ncbi:hypothetical protein AGMMS49975_10020 [Clostridia bacterium]|nr:hypothetical protein AGMMS49975_10020 [Clostridia bacterium]
MEVVVPKAVAQTYANLVRVYALSQFPSWRPFAYRFEGKASLLSTDLFVDKPLNIHCEFSRLSFEGISGENGAVLSEKYSVGSAFSVGELKANSNFSVLGADAKIAQAVSPTKIEVYYLYDVGVRNESENRALIKVDSNIVVFSTRHSKLDAFGFKIDDADAANSRISFSGIDDSVITDSLTGLQKLFSA